MRAIYSGSISIGMMRVPVSAYKARNSYLSPFNLVSECCSARVKLPKTCGACEKPCTTKRAVNVGTKKNPEYVIFNDGELGSLESGNIEITSIGEADVDSLKLRLAEPYYLCPQKKKKDFLKLYSLFHKELSDKGVKAFGTIIMRNRQKPCVIIPDSEGLVLWLLNWAEDVRDRPRIESCVITQEESEKMQKAMNALASGLKKVEETLAQKDEYREMLSKAVANKLAGHEIETVSVKSDGLLDQLDTIAEGL